MGNFNKWNRDEADTNPDTNINVVLFVSRNKDNVDIPDFHERRNAFVTTKTNDQLKEDFNAFVRKGRPNEFCRMYISVNPRSNKKTQNALMHQLIDEQYNMATLPQRVAALAAKKENAANSKHLKWLFDFDPIDGYNTEKLSTKFMDDIMYYHLNTRTENNKKRPPMNIEAYRTPNGYAIVVDQRFDTQKLLNKWTNVELKRDDLLCVDWQANDQQEQK